MRVNYKFIVMVIISLLVGMLITWIDTRPNWDDTGITAGMIVLTSALFGYLYPTRPWVWALTVSGWIPAHYIVTQGNYTMLLVLLFGFAGAFLGAAIRNNKPQP